MKKLVNVLITSSAILGVIIMILAVNKVDYMIEIGENYPLTESIKTMCIGMSFLIPSVVRRIYGKKFA